MGCRMDISGTRLTGFNAACRLIHECRSPELFGQAVLSSLHRLVPFEKGIYINVNLSGAVEKVELRDDDARISLNYNRYLAKVDSKLLGFFRHASANWPVLEKGLPDAGLRESCLAFEWADCKAFSGVNCSAAINLFNANSMLRICLYRAREQRNYTDSEFHLLGQFAAQIKSARNSLELAAAGQRVWETLHNAASGVCVFDGRMECIYINQKACEAFLAVDGNLLDKLREAVINAGQRQTDASSADRSADAGFLRCGKRTIYFNCFAYQDSAGQPVRMIMFDIDAAPCSEWRESASQGQLTRRERDILRLLSQGKTNKEISEALFISLETVKTHIKNLLAKTGARSRTALAARRAEFENSQSNEAN